MVWWLKNRFKIEMLIFLLTGMGLLIGVGSPTPGKGVGECLVTIMGRNNPGGLSPWAHSPPMGPKAGPKAQPICGLGWVGLWALWAMQRSTSEYTTLSDLDCAASARSIAITLSGSILIFEKASVRHGGGSGVGSIVSSS